MRSASESSDVSSSAEAPSSALATDDEGDYDNVTAISSASSVRSKTVNLKTDLVEALQDVMTSSETQIERFELTSDIGLKVSGRSLGKLLPLFKEVSLDGQKISEEDWEEWSDGLDRRVKQKRTSQSVELRNMDLRGVSNEVLAALFSSIGKIELNKVKVSPDGWKSCTTSIVDKYKVGEGILEDLKLTEVDLHNVSSVIIATLFATMKKVELNKSVLSPDGWQAFADKNSVDGGILQNLKLTNVDLDDVPDETLSELFFSIKNIELDHLSNHNWKRCAMVLMKKHNEHGETTHYRGASQVEKDAPYSPPTWFIISSVCAFAVVAVFYIYTKKH